MCTFPKFSQNCKKIPGSTIREAIILVGKPLLFEATVKTALCFDYCVWLLEETVLYTKGYASGLAQHSVEITVQVKLLAKPVQNEPIDWIFVKVSAVENCRRLQPHFSYQLARSNLRLPLRWSCFKALTYYR